MVKKYKFSKGKIDYFQKNKNSSELEKDKIKVHSYK